MSSLTPGTNNDENGVHHHQSSRKTPILARSNHCDAGVVEEPGHLMSSSLGSQSQDSLNEQPRNKLLGKWHRNISFGWKLLCIISTFVCENNSRIIYLFKFTSDFKTLPIEFNKFWKSTQN